MSLFKEFKKGLGRTSKHLRQKIQSVFRGQAITEEFLDDLEAILIQSDVGVKAALELRENLREESRKRPIRTENEFYEVMAQKVEEIFETVNEPLRVASQGPTVYVMVGVNGSGKTTTIAKLAKRWKDQGKKVILAAADTFRAAAKDQLAIWAKRVDADIISHQEGSDPGAVAFDAARAALARKADLLLVDTAGRLHTNKNLMEELKKIVRVVSREIPGAPHEVILVIDGTTGQNGLSQAKTFAERVGVTGICITKLDGSSKGGIAVAIAKELKIPVKLVGVGEGVDDLQDFEPHAFALGLFCIDESKTC